MRTEPEFNPLDKKNLGTSVAEALLSRPRCELPPSEAFAGAGVYAVYYRGDFAPYQPLALRNSSGDERNDKPIYVGRAVPAGARKGLLKPGNQGAPLYNRLAEHAASIEAVDNLKREDFFCRYLIVDDIWIPLGESLLISMFRPLWNQVVDGFGNHDPGSGRHAGRRAPWDMIHSGRPWAAKLQAGRSVAAIGEDISKFLSAHSE